MTPDQLLLIYLVVLLSAISAVVVYYEFRRKRFEPTPSRDRIFRCKKCAFVYTDDADVERSRCPGCGVMNEEIEF
jgi:rubrerythrin